MCERVCVCVCVCECVCVVCECVRERNMADFPLTLPAPFQYHFLG